MNDEDWAQLEIEAQKIMDEVNSDPDIANATPPEDLHDKVMEYIHQREYEEGCLRLVEAVFGKR